MFKSLTRSKSRRQSAFTIIELLVVLFVISLLLTIAVPAFAKFTKTSKVQEAATAVDSALFQARSQAQNLRVHVGVFFGADMSSQGLQLTPTTPLPQPGSIEVWGVLGSAAGFGGYNGTTPMQCPGGSPNDYWFPYKSTTKLLMRTPITLPDGIKVVAGYFYRYPVGSNYNCVFGFPFYSRTPLGEVKRHETVFSITGGIAMNQSVNEYNYPYLLIYDEATGEHIVMEAGRPQTASRPRILPYQLTHIGYYNAATNGNPTGAASLTALTDMRKLANLIDTYPSNDP